MRYAIDDPPQDAYFLFRGVTEDHSDAIEAVLERHHLVAALEEADGVRLMGTLPDDEQSAWNAAYELGLSGVGEVATRMGCAVERATQALDDLCRRRLVMRIDGQFSVVGSARG
jgi:hypothetical protein